MYEMSDIGHKNVCRILLLDEVKKIWSIEKKHSIIAFDSIKKQQEWIAHPKYNKLACRY